MDCYIHPGVASTAACAGCGQPICSGCGEEIAGHRMCSSCVAAAQARIAAEQSVPSFSAPLAPASPVLTETPAPLVQPGVLAGAATEARAHPGADYVAATVPEAPPFVPEKCGASEYLKALAFGGIAAVVGAIIWDKLTLWSGGWQIGFVAVILGAAVGVAVKMGAGGKAGPLLPWMGALLAGFAIVLGYALLANDQIAADTEMGPKFAQIPLLLRLPLLFIGVLASLDLMSWVFVAIGVWEGWSIPWKAAAGP
jgi:hypothetical protein